MVVAFKLRTVVSVFIVVSIVFTTIVFVLASGEESSFIDLNDGVKLPIIMYHGILKDKNYSGKFVITPDEFEEDLKYLKENEYTAIFMSQLIDYVEKGVPLPKKPVIITFDDGYYNNYIYAYPLIKKYDMKMVLSVVGKYSDQYSESNEKSAYYSHVTWEEVKEMSSSEYVEIQNHSYDMHTISEKRNGSKKAKGESDEEYKTVLTNDVKKTQELIKKYTGKEPDTYTYPFGSISNFSVDVLKEAGFKATLGCASGTNNITRNKECLYKLKRYIRPHGKPLSKILD